MPVHDPHLTIFLSDIRDAWYRSQRHCHAFTELGLEWIVPYQLSHSKDEAGANRHGELVSRLMRDDGSITRLILLNGPPGVGKSTLARRYVDDHPLTLLLEVDAIRVTLGCWQDHDESRLLARSIALAVADAHLRSGHDVIVPQYLGRTEFISALGETAEGVGAEFVELLVQDTATAVIERFRGRRRELADQDRPHPQADVDAAAVPAMIADACARLQSVKSERPHTQVIMATGGVESGYRALRHAVGDGRSGDPYTPGA